MSARPVVGWVVDVQNDFMRPDGRLYVRHLNDPDDAGATAVTDELVRAVRWFEEHADLIVFTGDWHSLEDDEIDPVSPDPTQGTYPPHCMGRSDDPAEREGAALLPEIAPDDPLIMEVDADAAEGRRVAREAVESGRPVFIRKTRFDVFDGNAGTAAFVEEVVRGLGAPEFVVVGVARDVCVTQAVDGLVGRGHAVTALRDATWGLGLEPEEVTLARWAEGAAVRTFEDFRRASEGRVARGS